MLAKHVSPSGQAIFGSLSKHGMKPTASPPLLLSSPLELAFVSLPELPRAVVLELSVIAPDPPLLELSPVAPAPVVSPLGPLELPPPELAAVVIAMVIATVAEPESAVPAPSPEPPSSEQPTIRMNKPKRRLQSILALYRDRVACDRLPLDIDAIVHTLTSRLSFHGCLAPKGGHKSKPQPLKVTIEKLSHKKHAHADTPRSSTPS